MRIAALFRLVLALGFAPATCAAQAPVAAQVAAISFAPRLGDVKGNIAAMHALAADAIRHGARIVVFPELATTGYSVDTWPAPHTLAIAQPFSELSALADLAKQHASLIVAGIAERDGAKLYNSAVIIEPSGKISVQRKRWGFSGAWHQRGDTPIEVYGTPWGTVAVAICADTFNMESTRVAALKGADILLVPANWWGPFGQLSLWQTRARENGVWLAVANRLGREPTAYSRGAVQDMRGPSAIISPLGHVLQVHDPGLLSTEPDSVVLYQTVDAAARRELVKSMPHTRMASADAGIGPVHGTPPDAAPPMDVPPGGLVPVHVVAYEPSLDASENLETLKRELSDGAIPRGALVVLPGLGLSAEAFAGSHDPRTSPYWAQVASLVLQSGVQAVITSVPLREEQGRTADAVAYITATSMTVTRSDVARGGTPLVVNHRFGKVGIVTGDDALLPEVPAQLGRSGVDIVVVVSTSGSAKHRQWPGTRARMEPLAWSFDELARHWVWATVNCLHVVANDASGHAVAASAERGCDLVRETRFFRHASRGLTFDTEPIRRRVFPALLPDERDLLSMPRSKAPAAPAMQ